MAAMSSLGIIKTDQGIECPVPPIDEAALVCVINVVVKLHVSSGVSLSAASDGAE